MKSFYIIVNCMRNPEGFDHRRNLDAVAGSYGPTAKVEVESRVNGAVIISPYVKPTDDTETENVRDCDASVEHDRNGSKDDGEH